MLQLYKNIKSKRIELKMTQAELAKKLGYADKSMIAKIEKGLVDLTQSKILAFAKALDTTSADLMGWEEETITVINNSAVTFATIYELFGYEVYSLCDSYLSLSDDGQKQLLDFAVFLLKRERGNDFKLMTEKEVAKAFSPNNINKFILPSDEPLLNAAHALPNATTEDKLHDEDIMNDDDF